MIENIARIVVKAFLFLIFVVLLVFLFHEAAKVGYSVFADKPYTVGTNAPESIITVTEGEPLLDIAKDLEKNGIVKNAYITAAAFRTMEGYDRIKPGEYMLNSSMKPSEIMQKLIGEEEEE